NRLADIAMRLGEADQARGYYEQDLAIARRLAEADPVNIGKQRDVIISLRQLGQLLSGTGDRERGEAILNEAIEIARQIGFDLGLPEDTAHSDQPDRRRRWPFGRRRP
ncbi:tetratricopeptide repeat protein, partial [Frankia sp. Cas4]|uniref:tetratricopeptide repeat protein n=1 Tax=Frankia sp. Cas4 TaxID=3073927 RepID=UPI002AD5718A